MMSNVAMMAPSGVAKRAISIDGHKTSVSMEPEFWDRLKDIARERQTTLTRLVAKIDGEREVGNLSSCLRVFVLETVARR
jgi:predicted DNA-binding ribbon-helix-helix protein